jgi:hypothetical protein
MGVIIMQIFVEESIFNIRQPVHKEPVRETVQMTHSEQVAEQVHVVVRMRLSRAGMQPRRKEESNDDMLGC